MQRARAVAHLERGEVVPQEPERAVDAIERRAQARAGGEERGDERRERESMIRRSF